jgi:hypothetical protein
MPEYKGPHLSSVVQLIDYPILLTGFFRDHFARHFASAATVEVSALQHLIWKDNERTTILIESLHRWEPRTTGLRPAILIKRNAFKNRREGIGDRKQLPAIDITGNPHFLTFWVGSHTLFCIGGTGAQAESLATEVRRDLVEFGPAIKNSFKLLRFQAVEVGAISELEEATENFVVPVTVGWAFEESWQLMQQAPRLKRISLSSLLDA